MGRYLKHSFLLGALVCLPLTLLAAGLDDILTRGSVNIGVAEFIPWTFKNRDGNLEGFEIDVGRDIAQEMGVKPEFKVYRLEELFDVLDKGEIDFIAAGLAITPERALRVEFSLPYSRSGTTLVGNSGMVPGAKTVDDFNRKGYVIMTVADTFSAEIAQELFDVAEVRTVADGPAAEKELVQGHAQGYLTSLADAGILMNHYPGKIYLPLADPLVGSVAGLAVKRGNQALLNYLNAWITAKTASRWLPSSHDYWFSSFDWAGLAQ